MCKHFHESVRKMSEKYEQEMKRCNYVTPTSYLELLGAFRSLLEIKRKELREAKSRYKFATKRVGAPPRGRRSGSVAAACSSPLSHFMPLSR